MPDAPDWYMYRKESSKDILGDLSELAVRLGSVVSYDRRGTVVWLTDMRHGITPFVVTGDDDTFEVRVDTGYALYGGYVMVLKAGSGGQEAAGVYRTFPAQTLNKWGIELGVYFPTSFHEFHFLIGHYDGTYARRAKIVFSDDDQKIYYRDVDNNEIEVGDLPEMTSLYAQIQNVKLVIDVEKYEYVKLLLNTFEFDLSGTTLWTTEANDNPQSRCGIQMWSDSGEQQEAYIDYVIFTIDEP